MRARLLASLLVLGWIACFCVAPPTSPADLSAFHLERGDHSHGYLTDVPGDDEDRSDEFDAGATCPAGVCGGAFLRLLAFGAPLRAPHILPPELASSRDRGPPHRLIA